MDWKPIYKNSSLPYNEGDRFRARRNQCMCNTEEVNVIKCLKGRPCVEEFITLNELRFSGINPETGRSFKHTFFSKEGIIRMFKYWKIIQPERSKREDIFVCQCLNTCVLNSLEDDSKNDYTKLNCCHCRQLVMRCSEHCRNAVRGK